MGLFHGRWLLEASSRTTPLLQKPGGGDGGEGANRGATAVENNRKGSASLNGEALGRGSGRVPRGLPSVRVRSITGKTIPRKLTTPSRKSGVFGTLVSSSGIRTISCTVSMGTPYSSFMRRKTTNCSSSSIMLVLEFALSPVIVAFSSPLPSMTARISPVSNIFSDERIDQRVRQST